MDKNIIWESFHFDFQKKDEERTYDTPQEAMMEHAPSFMDTPFGVYSMDDSMNPFKSFEFWMGHTNFHITKEIFQKLDNILGIESLTVLTPLRFIISIGKAFKSADVKARIEHDLCGKHVVSCLINNIQNKEVREKASSEYKKVKGNRFWLMYIFPNGNVESRTSDSADEHIRNTNIYKEVRRLSEGILLNSDDENNSR